MTGQRDDGQEVVETTQSLQVGEVLDVVVEDLPGAGYRWEAAPVPDGLVRLPDTGTHAARDTGGDVGGSARRVLHLRAERPGSFLVVLRLVRPWQPAAVPPAQERRLTVVVARPIRDDHG